MTGTAPGMRHAEFMKHFVGVRAVDPHDSGRRRDVMFAAREKRDLIAIQ
jgi:hypothetical protein